MKRRIKWENIICLIIFIILLVLYILILKTRDFNLDNIKEYRLFLIVNFIYFYVNLANILLNKCLKNIWGKKGEKKNEYKSKK